MSARQQPQEARADHPAAADPGAAPWSNRGADRRTAPPPRALEGREIALVDLLDRVLAGGVVISGDLTLSIADIDLVRISLRALVASVRVDATASGPPR